MKIKNILAILPESITNLNKFVRFSLLFDGSVTKMIEHLSNKKVSVKIYEECEKNLTQICKESLNKNTSLNNEAKCLSRTISLSIDNIPLAYARSYWSLKAYDEIMSQAPQKPIGINMIEQKIQTFRQVNWIGNCDLQIGEEIKCEKIYSRSYKIRGCNGKDLCQIEQYYLAKFYEIYN